MTGEAKGLQPSRQKGQWGQWQRGHTKALCLSTGREGDGRAKADAAVSSNLDDQVVSVPSQSVLRYLLPEPLSGARRYQALQSV